MPDIVLVIIFSLLGGVVSLTGGVALLTSKHRVKLAEFATALAAGALLAAAFVDLLPEALSLATTDLATISVMVLVGILVFFLMESLLHWFHGHRHNSQHTKSDSHKSEPVIPLLIIGDTLHNFIDGIAIAAGFMVSPVTGIIATIAVSAHEIPKEIGDFGLLLSKGMSRTKVLLVNVLSALATVVAAVLFFIIGESVHIEIAPVLALIAGFFIYIAVSDIIPSIHHRKNRRYAIIQSAILLAGVALVSLFIWLLRQFI